MSTTRRTTDRRRRVLYTTQQGNHDPPSAAQRRASEKLREARRPAAAYGSRVNRQLRGRWFSLVPIKKRAILTFTVAIAAVCFSLIAMHYLANTWPPLAATDREAIARPLKLQRPESFGRYLTSMTYVLTAGTILLVYQIRRYRNDDFQGHYRLWRIALAVTVFASLNSVVGVVDWCGSLIDLMFGKRVALQGGDWLRILLTFAGAIFAVRMIVEVRRSKWSVIAMTLGWICVAIPVAAKWNVMEVETIGPWMAITTAPLLACGCFWIATTSYLRLLVREVRGIENELTPVQRIRAYASTLTPSIRRDVAVDDSPNRPVRPERAAQRHTVDADVDSSKEDAETTATPRRGLLARFRNRQTSNADASEVNSQPKAAENSGSAKRSRFSFRLQPKPTSPVDAEPSGEPFESTSADSQSTTEPDSDDDTTKKKPGGLMGWLGRRGSSADASDEADDDAGGDDARDQDDTNTDSSDNGGIDEGDIDWSSLNKSERRRLRKELKRQGRAA